LCVYCVVFLLCCVFVMLFVVLAVGCQFNVDNSAR
jgi:hypothetical protein